MRDATLRRCASVLAGIVLAAGSLPAAAHDSWLVPRTTAGGSAPLALGFSTGNRYPVGEVAPSRDSVVQARCVDGGGRTQPLRATSASSTQLQLQARAPARGARGCWAELREHEVALDPALVEVYFREIRPLPQVRALWSAQLEAGQPWRERYRKFARIELATESDDAASLAAIRRPAGLPLEIVPVGDAPLRAGQPATFQVLSDGVALPELSVELVGERSAIGVWSRSDAQGQVRVVLPFAGPWLLRATHLARDEPAGVWRSRFVTLAFQAR